MGQAFGMGVAGSRRLWRGDLIPNEFGKTSANLSAEYLFGPHRVSYPFVLKGLLAGYTVTGGDAVAVADASGCAFITVTTPSAAPVSLVVKNQRGDVLATLALAGDPPTFVDGTRAYTYTHPFGGLLYASLPAAMRDEDEARGYPLQQLLQVLGVTGQTIYDAANRFTDLVDVDTCPVAQLAGLSGMLGFDFPYDLSESQQRAFVRNAVALYRIKGTKAALKFVVTRFIGNQFQLDITNEDWQAKTFTLQLTALQDSAALNAIEGKVAYLVNLYKPAGIIPTIVSSYFFDEAAPDTNRSDAVHASTQFDAWRFNQQATRFNTRSATGDLVSFNNRGSTPLTI